MEKKKLNILLIVLAVCIVVVATVLGIKLAGQSSNSGTEEAGKDVAVSGDSEYIEPVTEIEIPDDGMYSVEVKTEGDMFFKEIGVYIYTDSTLEELVWFDKTDENGIAEFTAEDATGYVVVLQNIPEGYQMQEYYYITGAKTEIVLTTALKEGVDLSEINYELGDVIHDFSVTAPDGTVYTVSEILEEKKAIILNFWYVQCGPCKEEFPYMGEAYAEYKDKIEILAMNPVNLDDEEIAKYSKDMGIKFPMMQCEEEWATALGITAYPTTVVIDRYGVISLMHRGSLPDAEIFKQLFAFYSADDYKQTVVNDIYDIVSTQLSQGTMDNPFELGGILDFEITIRPEQIIYFNMYRVDGMNVRIEDTDAYAIYEDETYYPSDGVVGLKVHCPDTYTPAFVGIGNAGTQKKTFHVVLTADLGTYENPHTLKLGEFTAKVSAENDQGVFYEYRADKTGALTLQCLSASNGVKYSYYLQNMRTSENRNLDYDSKTDGEGNVTVSLNVEKGDRVLICISTLPDASGNYPAGSFKMKASLGNSLAIDEQYYSVSIVDDNLNKVGGTSIKLTCLEIAEIEGVDDSQDEEAMKVGDEVSLTTDSKGVASRKLRIGSYKAVVTVPSGYTADTTEYVLTKETPDITFMLTKKVVKMVNYKVTVLNEEGKPIPDALVGVGDKKGKTDANGEITFKLPEGTYEAAVQANEYVSKTCAFEEGKTELSVTLEKSSGGSTAEVVDYTITISYMGTPVSGFSESIDVYFKENGAFVGTPATVSLTESAPQATLTVQLPKGNYTVELDFADDCTLRSYTSDMSMTEENRSLVINVGEAIDASDNTNSVYLSVVGSDEDNYASQLQTGANPVVNMDPNNYNYFIFEPTVSGRYKFYTDNVNAELTPWNGSPFYCYGPNTEHETYVDNSYTVTVKEGNIGGASYIMALKGVQSATLIVERIGDVAADPPEEKYAAKTPPKPFTYKGGSLTRFDETESDSSKYALTLGNDGYYYLNGKLVYVDLDYSALSMASLVESSSMKYEIYDSDGNVVRKVDYTDCLIDYVEARDENTGYYPLTEDLRLILQNGGGAKGWWDSSDPNYRFDGEVNTEIAWLFFCYSAGIN